MDSKAGVLLAFVLGAILGYKWPMIKKTLTPLASKAGKEVVTGYLAVKDGIFDVSGYFRKVADEVGAEAKPSQIRKVAAAAKT